MLSPTKKKRYSFLIFLYIVIRKTAKFTLYVEKTNENLKKTFLSNASHYYCGLSVKRILKKLNAVENIYSI